MALETVALFLIALGIGILAYVAVETAYQHKKLHCEKAKQEAAFKQAQLEWIRARRAAISPSNWYPEGWAVGPKDTYQLTSAKEENHARGK